MWTSTRLGAATLFLAAHAWLTVLGADGGGEAAPRVLQKLVVDPAVSVVVPGGAWQFRERAYDQFGEPLDGLPAAFWSAATGGLIHSDTGLLFADTVPGGPHTVRVERNGVVGTATFTIANTTAIPVAAEADAYVRDGRDAGRNFGTAPSLRVKNTAAAGHHHVAYLRFPLRGAPREMLGVKLRLYGRRAADHTLTNSAYAVPDTSWSETGLCWNNRPPLGELQGPPVEVTGTAAYYEWDVSDHVREALSAGAATVSLAVTMDYHAEGAADTFNAREASGHPPALSFLLLDESAPRVEVAASASHDPVTAATTHLSVRGADDGGEAALTYTWSAIGDAPAPVTFSPNGSHAARNTTATFTKEGAYTLRVSIRDAVGKVVTSDVLVSVPSASR